MIKNALGVDFASATRRPGARPTQPAFCLPLPAIRAHLKRGQTVQTLRLFWLSTSRSRLHPRETVHTPSFGPHCHPSCLIGGPDKLHFCWSAPESYVLVNSHCCDTIRMSFVKFSAGVSVVQCAVTSASQARVMG